MRTKKELTAEVVAKKMNISTQTLRLLMQQGDLPFGKAFKPTGGYYTYVFYPEKVKEYLGE